MKEKVAAVFQKYVGRGDIRDDELDDAVKDVCSRHSLVVVDQALKEYVEMRGDGLKNASAYLNSILSRVAADGVEASEREREKMRKREAEGRGGRRGGKLGAGGAGEKRKREGREGDRDGEAEDAVERFNKLTAEKSKYGDGEGKYGGGGVDIRLESPDGGARGGKVRDNGLFAKVFKRERR